MERIILVWTEVLMLVFCCVVNAKIAEKPAELTQTEWESVKAQIRQTYYWPSTGNTGGYKATNHTYQWQVNYQANGQTVLSNEHFQIGMTLQSVGGELISGKPKLEVDKGVMYYHHNPIIKEWWVNTAEKLEQWFEIKNKPRHRNIGLTVKIDLNSSAAVSQSGNQLVFTADNGHRINYDQLLVWDSRGQILDSQMQLAEDQQSFYLHIDDHQAQYPITIDPSFTQENYIKPVVLDPLDEFGIAVDISGNYMIVGTLAEDSASNLINGDSTDNSANNAGAAYIFARSGNSWVQEAYLKASNAEAGDVFGESVAISGWTAVVGAPNEDGDANSTVENPNNNQVSGGAVYVFVRQNDGTWVQQAYLKAHQTGSDEFAETVDIDGNTIVVGSKWEDGDSNSTFENTNELAAEAGAVYVFTRVSETWTQSAYLKASNAEAGDRFGYGVAIDGDTIVVSAKEEDGDSNSSVGAPNNAALDAGAVYIFEKDNNEWIQTAYLKAHNAGVNDLFGEVVGIHEDSIVVGAYKEDGDASSNINQDNNNAIDSGAAYVFAKVNGIWEQQAYLKASNAESEDEFGWSVAIEGNKVIVGAPKEDGDELSTIAQPNNDADRAGAAYIFTRRNQTWQQSDYLKAGNLDAFDQFGMSVSFSQKYTVVGSKEDGDANSTMENPNNNANAAGAVYLFESRYFVGGDVFGLPFGESVGLIRNGIEQLMVNNNGYYQFATGVVATAGYSVGISSTPTGFDCTVVNGSGSVPYDDVTDVNVYCASDSYQVGASVSGLAGNGLLLRANDVFDLNINSNGTHFFSTTMANGTPYQIEVVNQPDNGQTCVIDVAEGVINGTDVVAAVICSGLSFDVGGTVSGLDGSLVLQNNGADDLSISNNGAFTFSEPIDDGEAYSVSILSQPSTQACVVSQGSGIINGADVNDVEVNCSTNTYFVGGSVNGLNAPGLTLQNNGADDIAINGNGGFVFSQPIDDGSQYTVSVDTEPDSQQCQVNNGNGFINGEDVIDVMVNCQDLTYLIGVNVNGLIGLGLVFENNDTDTLVISQNGISPFTERLTQGSVYDVQIVSQPNDTSNTCEFLSNNEGVVGANNVLINVLCGNDLIYENSFE